MIRYTMNHNSLAALLQGYDWRSSLYVGAGIAVATLVVKLLRSSISPFREAQQLNQKTYLSKMERPDYAANHRWNRKWSAAYLLVIFGLILPFCVTSTTRSVLSVLVDIVVILMVYDLVYYCVHRFLFHGPILVKVHAIHHRQHNPCRMDASYIHPLEVAIGLGLYVTTIFGLSFFMGRFNVVTVVLTWMAFTEINLHNHDLWSERRFPFKYFNYMSTMHHNHHGKFTGGNFATISLLYDWMFGTLDNGQGYRAKVRS
jgi:sterol desaturase/sphingolipid hydroxylase (fatty acid hydroxylase superfamily)